MQEYNLRHRILTCDPLCAVDAFEVLVRIVLALLLGIRMPRLPPLLHDCRAMPKHLRKQRGTARWRVRTL